jgi:hypothetical protein
MNLPKAYAKHLAAPEWRGPHPISSRIAPTSGGNRLHRPARSKDYWRDFPSTRHRLARISCTSRSACLMPVSTVVGSEVRACGQPPSVARRTLKVEVQRRVVRLRELHLEVQNAADPIPPPATAGTPRKRNDQRGRYSSGRFSRSCHQRANDFLAFCLACIRSRRSQGTHRRWAFYEGRSVRCSERRRESFPSPGRLCTFL